MAEGSQRANAWLADLKHDKHDRNVANLESAATIAAAVVAMRVHNAHKAQQAAQNQQAYDNATPEERVALTQFWAREAARIRHNRLVGIICPAPRRDSRVTTLPTNRKSMIQNWER